MTTRSGVTRRALVFSAAAGIAATTAPLAAQAQSKQARAKAKGRIVVYREAAGENFGWPAKLNGEDIRPLHWESYVAAERTPGRYTLSLTAPRFGGAAKEQRVTIAAGQTRYYFVRLTPKAREAVNTFAWGAALFGNIGSLPGRVALQEAAKAGWCEIVPGSAATLEGRNDTSR